MEAVTLVQDLGSASHADVATYFEYSSHGVRVVGEGLTEIAFGEFLVDCRAMDRSQLMLALQLQDIHPARLLGECVTALGFVTKAEMAVLLRRWNELDVVDVESARVQGEPSI